MPTNGMPRRNFVAAAVGAGILQAKGTRAGEETKDDVHRPLPIVDAHQHLWDLTKFRLPWIEKKSRLDRNFVTADYVKAAEGLNVAKAIYMEVDVEPSQQQAEADALVELCNSKKGPTVAGVISGRPDSDAFKKYITLYRDSKYVKGVRRVLQSSHTPAGCCTTREFIRGVGLLGDLGLRFDVCISPANLPDAVRLIDACPGTQFILDHCGNADLHAADQTLWKRNVAAIARRKHVVCKVSGFIAAAKPGAWSATDLAPIVNHVLDSFGPDRVLFGGDWPVCTLAASLAEWVGALKSIVHSRPAADQRKLFAENAIRVYQLPD